MDAHVFKQGPFPSLVGVVTTLYGDTVNVAPVTWWTPCSYEPPLIMMAIKKDNDTFKNILFTKEFVIQTVKQGLHNDVHQCAKSLPRDVSELTICKTMICTESNALKTPRIEQARDWYECVLWDVRYMVESHAYVFGKVVDYGKTSLPLVLMYEGGRKYSLKDTVYYDGVEAEEYTNE